MDIFDLEQRQIGALFYRCKGLTPQQAASELHLSQSAFFDSQSSALDKLEIPGRPKEKFGNFQRQGLCNLVGKLSEDDIRHWDERQKELRKKLLPEFEEDRKKKEEEKKRRRWRLLFDLVLALASFLIGILVDRYVLPPAAQVLPKTPQTLIEPPVTPNATLETTNGPFSNTIQVPTATSPTPLGTPLTPNATLEPIHGPLSDNSQVPPAQILFSDDFSNGMSEVWKHPVYGDVPFIEGEERALKFKSKTKIVIGDSTWTNYEVSFDVSNVSCQGGVRSSTTTVGLHYQDSGDMIAFRWLHWENSCQPVWLQGKEDQWKILAERMFEIPPKDTSGRRHLVVSVQGDDYSTSFGGLISVPDVPPGKVVLIADEGVLIDNFQIRQLP
jgi:hypothetical protein